MRFSKWIFLLFIICITFVGLVASIKVDQKQTEELRSVRASAINREELYVDPAFYSPSVIGTMIQRSIKKIVDPQLDVKSKPQEDPITAKAYLIGDLSTGKVLLEKNGKTVLPVASMSKLVTAFVATDELDLSSYVSITPEQAELPTDGSGMKAGERFTVADLLYPVLLDSSNIAAEAIASSSNRAYFLEQMNAYSTEIGMDSVFFDDPSGLSPLNRGSARGFFALARYLYKSRPDILAITKTPTKSVASTTDHAAHTFKSTHPFVNDPRFLGGKTGRTYAAGETMMTIMNINGQPVAIIVLGSEWGSRAPDTALLIEKASKLISSPQYKPKPSSAP